MDENRYRVEAAREAPGWTVRILDPAGRPVFSRACGDEAAARVVASTVRQHIVWLSERRFREYYRLPEPDAPREQRGGAGGIQPDAGEAAEGR